jgi:hypothetical protein
MSIRVNLPRNSLAAQVRNCWNMLADAVKVNPTGPSAAKTSTEHSPRVPIEQRFSALARTWKKLHNRYKTDQTTRKLRVCESTQLGDKKFVAVIQVDGQRFLIGATGTSISLLATLPQPEDFRSLLQQSSSLTVQE